MTHSEWHAFFMTLAQQEILTKTTMQYFTQVWQPVLLLLLSGGDSQTPSGPGAHGR